MKGHITRYTVCVAAAQCADYSDRDPKESAMSTLAKRTRSTVIPCLRYRNAAVAIDWLCTAFGFERGAVYTNPDGTIAHAQLLFGNGMIMLGSMAGPRSEWSDLLRQPEDIGGAETQSPYLVVTDADEIYE